MQFGRDDPKGHEGVHGTAEVKRLFSIKVAPMGYASTGQPLPHHLIEGL